jgi:tetratricopeptide (TPR) repeat protein
MTDMNKNEESLKLFEQAIDLLNNSFFIDGIDKFRQIIELDPTGDLADDAQFNIGLCYLKMNLPKQAIENFWKVIKEYPDSTIAFSEQNQEFGRTPAKAYLGLLTCYLQLGDEKHISECKNKLLEYEDSYVIIEEDEKVSYYELAKSMIDKVKQGDRDEQ